MAVHAPTARKNLEVAHQRLVEQVEQFADSEQWKIYLDVARRFHHYSPNNIALILSQRSDATQVASFSRWRSLGRSVRAGESGIKILAPCRYRVEGEVRGDSSQGEQWRIGGFRVVHVFDVSQTEGRPLPDGHAPKLLEGEGPIGAWDKVVDLLEREGFAMFSSPLGDVNGETRFSTRQVHINDSLPDAAALKTLVHELAHIRCDHGTRSGLTREQVECEAESVAYIVLGEAFGLDSSCYSTSYVTHWASGNADLVRTTMQRVVAVAHSIIDDCRDERQENA